MQSRLAEVKQAVQNQANTIATTLELVQQGANMIIKGSRVYLEIRIAVVKQQIDIAETTIVVVNHGPSTLKDRVTKL